MADVIPDYVIAGAASLEDAARCLADARQAGLVLLLVENAAMWSGMSASQRALVTCVETLPDLPTPVLPLNEYWVSQALRTGVANIAPQALRASRSKHALSARLAQCGLPALPRRYLENVVAPYPERYLARLDAAYSAYGIVRHVEAGPFDHAAIAQAVQADVSGAMAAVLDYPGARVVVEDYLEGEEYSADVFVRHDRFMVLRLFRKIIHWIGGQPVCDSYIAMPHDPRLIAAIEGWCIALYGNDSTSFGQFDFIVVADNAFAVDFSCRLGGGLAAIKRYAGIGSYVATALRGEIPAFTAFTVQKHLLAPRSGRLAHFSCPALPDAQLSRYKKTGDWLPPHFASANARIADICFTASDLATAIDAIQTLDREANIDVQD